MGSSNSTTAAAVNEADNLTTQVDSASARRVADIANKIVQCPICLDYLDDPKTLPCLHIFCFECLQTHCRDYNPGDEVRCPVCCSEFNMPSNGVRQLRSSFFIKDLLEAIKPLKSQLLKPLNTTISPREAFPGTNCCKVHSENSFDKFCFECKINVCRKCYSDKHVRHKCAPVFDVSEKYRELLEGDIRMVESEVHCTKKEVSKLNDTRATFFKKVKSTEKSLQEKGEEKLLKALSDKKSTAVKTIETVEHQLNFRLAALESFTTYTRKLLDNGKPCDVTENYNKLHLRAEELLKQNQMSTAEIHLPDISIISSIKETTIVKKILVLNVRKPVNGIAQLHGRLYVGYLRFDEIDVFDTKDNKFTKLSSIKIKELGGVSDIASCSHRQCIYIADDGKHVVYRAENRDKITWWSVKDQPDGLSVNSSRNVLVTCPWVSKVKEFTTDGQLVREISLQQDIIVHPVHTIQLTTGQFVICHKNEVCLVNDAGEILQSHGYDRGSRNVQLNHPVRLAFVNGFIFVADYYNYRVKMLSSQLIFIRILLSDALGVHKPGRLYIDEQTSQSFVGDGQEIHIYSLTEKGD